MFCFLFLMYDFLKKRNFSWGCTYFKKKGYNKQKKTYFLPWTT